MRKFALTVTLLLTLAACGGSSIARSDLAAIVVRDGMPFEMDAIPGAVIDRLVGQRVVVIGETHLIREQRQFTAALVQALHAEGYRQLLLEWPHMADWVMSEYVIDGDRRPGWWAPPTHQYGDLLAAIRDFNRTLPEDDRVAVRGIDVNLDEYGGATDFVASMGGLSSYLSDPGPLAVFLESDYSTAEAQTTALELLREELDVRRSELEGLWGGYWYDTVSVMVDVEADSVPIRSAREDDYEGSVQMREEVMKRLCDRLIAAADHSTVVNVGGHHAQKKRLLGTSHEWLGEYLVHHSTVAGGNTIVVTVVPARVTADYDTDVPDFDLMDESPENELFRLISETWPGQPVFLPFDDPVFATDVVPMNYEDNIHVAAPKQHYDAAVVLPLTHRIPLP